jgi:hypothetical protein
MSVRVTYDYKRPGDTREAAWLTDFCDDVRAATNELGDLNLGEEGIRLRHFQENEGPASFLGEDYTEVAEVIPAQLVFAPIPGAAAVILVGPFTVRPGERLRVRASAGFPTLILGPIYGIPGGTFVNWRIVWDQDTVATPNLFSEVRTSPAALDNESSAIATFATFYNNTAFDVIIDDIEPEIICSGTVRVKDVRIEADLFRRV